MLTLSKLTKLAALAVDDCESDVPNAGEDFLAWLTSNAAEVAHAMGQPHDKLTDALLRVTAADCAAKVLGSCRSAGVKQAVRDQRDRETSNASNEAAAGVALTAVPFAPWQWNLDPLALVACARAVGRGGTVVLSCDGLYLACIPARVFIEAARVTPCERWTVDMRGTDVTIACGGKRGYVLRGHRIEGNIASVALPCDLASAMPEPEEQSYDCAAE